VLGALRSWLNSWRGIGDVERGMARRGYNLQLTRYDARSWRATFYTTGMEHSPMSATTPLAIVTVLVLLAGCGPTTYTTNKVVREWARSPKAEERARAAEICAAAAAGFAALRRGESVLIRDPHVANVMAAGLGNPLSPCDETGSPRQ
jgi:hypothetical protein